MMESEQPVAASNHSNPLAGGPSAQSLDLQIDPLIGNPNDADWREDISRIQRTRIDGEALRRHKRSVRLFYKHQNTLIDMLTHADKIARGDVDTSDEEADSRHIKFAVYGSFLFNVVLLAVKIFIVLTSGSVAMLASLADSFLDILSGSILMITSCMMRRKDPHEFPIGKTRFEPLGLLIFSVAMFALSGELLVRSITAVVSGPDLVTMGPWALAGVGFTIVGKLILYAVCRSVAGKSASVAALAADHRNDVISNLVGTAGALAGAQGGPLTYADPIGAIILALMIMRVWFQTGWQQLKALAGRTADSSFLQKLTYVAQNHHPAITHVDTVRAYHLSYGFLVEVDIVLPEDMMLRETHDIGEGLQRALEQFDDVERAHVHVDCDVVHDPRSEHKFH
eukprot:NODE_1712_length_1432_cov_31.720174_g1544_i0.p1 GENE.NODE_1712_length_1432_cov_31.720174_g1544_i0~~NODE_1712_length_1432_cov_31.720174_g1544_i0.p1  ORF type:complete len:396 (-),score=57.12 NODE_1712_length_1432_cov_31.720174_g1544_i0:172-1359(-)